MKKEKPTPKKVASVSVRIDSEVKKRAEAILESSGVSPSLLVNVLYGEIILGNGIPFALRLPKSSQTNDRG